MSSQQSYIQKTHSFGVEINNSTGAGTIVGVYTASETASIGEAIRRLQVVSTDTAAITINFYLQIQGAGTSFLLGNMATGTTAGIPVDARAAGNMAALFELDPTGNKRFFMRKGDKLQAAAVTAPASGKVVHITGTVGVY